MTTVQIDQICREICVNAPDGANVGIGTIRCDVSAHQEKERVLVARLAALEAQ